MYLIGYMKKGKYEGCWKSYGRWTRYLEKQNGCFVIVVIPTVVFSSETGALSVRKRRQFEVLKIIVLRNK